LVVCYRHVIGQHVTKATAEILQIPGMVTVFLFFACISSSNLYVISCSQVVCRWQEHLRAEDVSGRDSQSHTLGPPGDCDTREPKDLRALFIITNLDDAPRSALARVGRLGGHVSTRPPSHLPDRRITLLSGISRRQIPTAKNRHRTGDRGVEHLWATCVGRRK
jgi:hypothetical protein